MSDNDAAGDISVSLDAHVATVEIHRPRTTSSTSG